MRSLGQALVAAAFIYDGIDAARHPALHVAPAQGPIKFLAKVLHQPEPSSDTMIQLIRAHGALVAVAGLSLAVGKAPRTSGTALAVLSAPLALTGFPLPQITAHGSDVPKPIKQAISREFLRKSALLGAAIITASAPSPRPTTQPPHASGD